MTYDLKCIENLLETLSNAHGVSGHEESLQEILKKKLEPYTNEGKTDELGNLIATKYGNKPSVMLCAHMDEVGMSTSYITKEDGFLHFISIGDLFDQTLLNQLVIF